MHISFLRRTNLKCRFVFFVNSYRLSQLLLILTQIYYTMKTSALLGIFTLLLVNTLFSQFPGCPSVDAGPDQSLNCSTPCVTLTATPFDAGATTSYQVTSVPHNPPIAYNQAGGNPVSVGVDDVWSPVINLPFNFCFYGQTYTSCVIGSNGTIGFNTAVAGGFQPWSYSASCPSAALTSAGNIFGPYHDIDPSIGGTVNWYLTGTAPCRIFVVSFNAIPHFSCTSISSTHMIVLYETTNAIDVYIQNKATCASWNSGNTVVGIQNMSGSQGLAAPGRNTGPWTVTTPEGWRFLPDGAPIYTVAWLENGNVISTADTVSVCPLVSTNYVAQATYTACDGTVIIETDTVNVAPSPGSITLSEVSNTPTGCGAATGSVQVSANGGVPGYNYSFNDTLNFQSSSTFTGLAAGTYTIYAQDQNGCIGGLVITIGTPDLPDLQEQGSIPSACGLPVGQIDLTVSGGTSPFTYSLNGGTPQSSSTFSGLLAGTYTLYVIDDNNCIDSVQVTITETPAPEISVVSTSTICANTSTGQVTVAAVSGNQPYTFTVDGGSGQASGVFTGLTAGSHFFEVTDVAGCTDTISAFIDTYPLPQILSDADVCNFSINVTGTSSFSGGVWSCADTAIHFSPDATFDNPSIWTYGQSGVYTVTFTDNICNEPVSTTLDFYEFPSTWTVDTSLCYGVIYTQTVPNDNPHTTLYTWSDGTLGTSLTVVQPGGTYYLTMANDCHTNYDTLTIDFHLCDVEVPNVISLAEGSQNPLWYVQAEGLGSFAVVITNRWGNVVYECEDKQGKCYWDGRNRNGVFVEEGTYFYNIIAEGEDGKELNKQGFIQVVR